MNSMSTDEQIWAAICPRHLASRRGGFGPAAECAEHRPARALYRSPPGGIFGGISSKVAGYSHSRRTSMDSVGETSQAGLARELTNLTKSLVIATRWALDHRIEQIGSASARFVSLTTSKSILRVPTFSILAPATSVHMGEVPGAFVSADRPTTLQLRVIALAYPTAKMALPNQSVKIRIDRTTRHNQHLAQNHSRA